MRVYWQAFIVFIAAVGFANMVGGLVNLHDTGTFGFVGQQITSRSTTFTVRGVQPHSPASLAGVRPNDTLSYDATFENRIRIGAPVPGDVVTFRDGSRAITLTAVADQSTPQWALLAIVYLAKLAFISIGVIIALRRADDGAARALALFLTCFGGAISYDFALVSSVLLRFTSFLLVQSAFLAGGLGILAFACRFPQAPTDGIRTWLDRALAPLAVIGFIVTLGSFLISFFSTNRSLAQSLTVAYLVLYLALIASTLAALVDSYRKAAREQRARMRWVIGTLAVGFSGIVVLFIGLALNVGAVQQQALQYGSLTVLAIPFGLGYVIFRHRVLDIGFVVNRAVVYTGVSLVVVGAFITFEWLLGHVLEQNSRASVVLELCGALALGLSTRYIHARVDGYVDDVFFRDRHAAEAAIRRFATETGMITDPDILIKRTVEVVQRNARLDGAAFYARLGSRFVPLHTTFADAASDLDENDEAILAMRTWHQPIEVSGESRVPGIEVFPMMVRGQLTGFLVCGEKATHEAFAPDERDAIRILARDAGTALDSLRISRIEHELAFLSTDGELPEAIRLRLSSLITADGSVQLAGSAARSSQ